MYGNPSPDEYRTTHDASSETTITPMTMEPPPTSENAVSTKMLNIAEFARWVPLRLSADERALLDVLEQTLHVSEYTDNVDVTMYNGGSSGSYYRKYNGNMNTVSSMSSMKTRRILDGILEVCHIATGLATASGQGKKFAELCYPGGHSATDMAKPATKHSSLFSTLLSSPSRKHKKEKKLKKKSSKQLLRKGKKNKHDNDNDGKDQNNDNNNCQNNNEDNVAEMNVDDSMELQPDGEDTAPAKRTSSSNGGSGHKSSINNYHIPWASREPHENAVLFQTMFEIGRRNKVLNPASMRTTYGKLMYLLQDAQNPVVAKSLGFSLHKDLVLVGTYLEQNKCLELLADPRLECAVQYVSDRDDDTGEKLHRSTLDALIKGKQSVMDELIVKYSSQNHHSSKLSTNEVKRIIESLADAVVYIESNVRPVQSMLQYLKQNFHPDQVVGGYSLSLRSVSRGGAINSTTNQSFYARYGLSAYGSGNSEGPTLSHSHSEQYTFVEQSLKLWCKVMRHMHRLWVCADDDLLSTTCTYHLYNTGQGLNRVQSCPRVRKIMTSLLHQTQQESGKPWVGLSVIHLGDRDVPNALIFIDKYTQIPRFLNPIVNFLVSLPTMMDDKRISDYIKEQFGTIDNLKMVVLQDYYKHGFDGSGDDGGSCIDGRLTSSWNWTSRLAKKSYYHTFMLSGFQGFDGDFR